MDNVADRVRQFCSHNGLKLNKDLGQNFLIEAGVLDSIMEAAQVTNTDHVLEIGPGIGILTERLLEAAKEVTAIEIDDRLPELIKKFIQKEDFLTKLTIKQGNALTTDFPTEPYKIVANIPYHITSPLLRKCFLETEVSPTTMTILMQKEVAEKICDDTDAGLLTILVKLFGTPELIRKVPPDCFLPPPKVDSAVLHVKCFETPVTDRATIEEIFKLTKIAFSQKRKMLRNTFGTFPGGLDLLEKVGIDSSRRPQTLSIDEWIAVATQAMS